jgi:hypothetical protein
MVKTDGGRNVNKNLKKSRQRPRAFHETTASPELLETVDREKYFHICVCIALFVLGASLSWLYFGHQAVPNPDFPAFVRVARSLLSFEMPSSFKRAPVLGLLQVTLSNFTKGLHPELTAGWLLNAILYPFCCVLFYLIAKEFIGKSACWLVVIAAVNPWTIDMLVEPLVEITLLFFILLTFYFILRRSKWCYLFAAIATMVRYEGAALIFAAFVIDMLESKTNRHRLLVLLYSALASIPLALWMLGTVVKTKAAGSGTTGHYLGHYGRGTVVLQYLTFLWQVTFSPIFAVQSKQGIAALTIISKVVAAAAFLTGTAYSLYRKKWDLLALLLFIFPYVLIHSLKFFTRHRYCMPIAWLVLLICWLGVQSVFGIIKRKIKIPPPVIILLQIAVLIVAIIWIISLAPLLPQLKPYSPTSQPVPYICGAAVLILFLIGVIIYGRRLILPGVTFSALVCLMVVSNQLSLVRIVGDGSTYMEFRMLAEWYAENAQPGERMVTALPNIVRLFLKTKPKNLVHLNQIKADSPEQFVEGCYKKNITYVSWDSIGGFNVNGAYYKKWGFKNIAMLARPQSIGPYEFVRQVRYNDRRFINIFRLRQRPPSDQ